MPYLMLLDDKGLPRREWSIAGRSVTVGRGADRDVQVDDPRLSRAHFRLEPGPSGVRCVLDGGRTGLWVNSKPVTDVELMPGDLIEAGDSHFTYQEGLETTLGRDLAGREDTSTVGRIIRDLRIPEEPKPKKYLRRNRRAPNEEPATQPRKRFGLRPPDGESLPGE